MNQLNTWRRELHQIPELGFDLPKTHAYVFNALKAMGYEPITMASTGVIVYKEGMVKEAIAFRADMDALPIQEEIASNHRSTHAGQMHACGHDGHMAMVLGLADWAKDKTFKHSLLFVFQPAEEGPGGAKQLIEEGLFEQFKVRAMFGLHLYPNLKFGQLALIKGPMMAQTNEFDLVVHGRSAHGAQPHLGVDAMIIQAQLVLALQSIVSRSVNPLDAAVVTMGTIQGGEARNIIPQQIELKGTIRCFNPKVFETIQERINAITQGLEHAYSCKIEVIFKASYPPVINPEGLYTMVDSLFNANEKSIVEPMMFAEDFSFYQAQVPAFFAMLGVRNEALDHIYPLHHGRFNFDEVVLEIGLDYYQRILEHYER